MAPGHQSLSDLLPRHEQGLGNGRLSVRPSVPTATGGFAAERPARQKISIDRCGLAAGALLQTQALGSKCG